MCRYATQPLFTIASEIGSRSSISPCSLACSSSRSSLVVGCPRKSIAHANIESACGDHSLAVKRDELQLCDRFSHGNEFDARRLKGHHYAILSRGKSRYGSRSESKSEYPVKGDRGTAPQKMPQHHRSRFFPSQLLQFRSDPLGYAAQTLLASRLASYDHYITANRLGSFCNHHDGVWMIERSNMVGYFLNAVRNLGDQDYIGATSDARIQSDPPGIATHYLHDHDAPVRVGRRVQPVYALRSEADGGLKSKRQHGRFKVVVDCLRHANHAESALVE